MTHTFGITPKNLPGQIISAGIIAVLIYLVAASAWVILEKPVSFDGAINAQAARNLAQSGRFVTTYNKEVQFDPNVQTGFPVLLPAAFSFMLFGAKFGSALLVNGIYFLGLAGLIVYILKSIYKIHNAFLLLALLLFANTPAIFDFGFGLYGEVPGLFFLVLALILLNRFSFQRQKIFMLLSGLCLGLGYLTKTVILIAVPAFVISILYHWITSKERKIAAMIQSLGLFLTGLITPVIVFELYKLSVLGWNEYQSWWRIQSTSISMQAGIQNGYKDTAGVLDKLAAHAKTYFSFFYPDQIILIVILGGSLIVGILLFYFYKKNKQTNWFGVPIDFVALFFIASSYFGWWLVITPTEKAWLRRIFDGTILLEIVVVIGLNFLFKKILRDYKPVTLASNIVLAAVIGLAVISTVSRSPDEYATRVVYASKSAVIDAGAFIQSLPPQSEFFGFGWWQAPVIAFASGKSFNDFLTVPAMNAPGSFSDKYLIIDDYAQLITPKDSAYVRDLFVHELVFSKENITIYKLLSRR